jgi:hypothetical protein
MLMKTQYDQKTDAVVYSESTPGFTRDDWINLAVAAADQAGIVTDLDRYKAYFARSGPVSPIRRARSVSK